MRRVLVLMNIVNANRIEVKMDINGAIRVLIVICGTLLIYSFRKSSRRDLKKKVSYKIKRFIVIFIICLAPIISYYVIRMYVNIVTTAYIVLTISLINVVGLICFYIWENRA